MKKSAFAIAFLLLVSILTYGQNFSMGFYLQPQLTHIGGDVHYTNAAQVYTMTTKPSFGFAFGLQTAYNFSDHSALSLGVTFSSQAQDYEDMSVMTSTETQSFGYSTSADYVKVPVLFEYTLNPDKKIAINFYGGAYVGFLASYEINSNLNTVNNGGTETYSKEMTASNKNISARVLTNGTPDFVYVNLSEECYNVFDFGAQIGAGIIYKASDKFSIPVSFNYEFSFSDLMNSDSYLISDQGSYSSFEYMNPRATGSMKNSLFGFRIGIRMRIGENPTFD